VEGRKMSLLIELKNIKAKLTDEEIKMIERIEELEIDMIKQGINPDDLTLQEIYDFLKKKNELGGKKEKYQDFQKRIYEHLQKD
jgi:hypothetical protein